jgi:hypothetical protein
VVSAQWHSGTVVSAVCTVASIVVSTVVSAQWHSGTVVSTVVSTVVHNGGRALVHLSWAMLEVGAVPVGVCVCVSACVQCKECVEQLRLVKM